MSDWQKLVRQQLAEPRSGQQAPQGVVEELAAHLQDACEALRREGLSESEAEQRALAIVGDWKDLRNEIRCVWLGEDNMQKRVSQLWLPGTLAFAVSMAFEAMMNHLDYPNPRIFSLGMGTPILKFYPAWLALLPLAGALGAVLSKRLGGSPRMMLGSSVFPAVFYGSVFLIAVPVGLLAAHGLEKQVLVSMVSLAALWVLLPALALLLGGLLVHLVSSRNSVSRGTGTG